ncbi:MAG: SDR family oxidoreductase [Anaerolineaceae bacterium]|nr:SDR family oxidoreductase [Anaerolineaceae bacterium]
MRILVTGAGGYIGSQLVPVLQKRGHDVVGLDAGFFNDGWLYGDRPKNLVIRKDIRKPDLIEVLQGFDACVHLGELSNDPLGTLNPEITYEINHHGSVHLAKMCKLAGIQRFVYSSSCSVYGIGNDGAKTEESDVNPQTPYADCKVLVERDVSTLADDDFTPVFLRNATAYGPSPRMRFDIVLNNLSGLAWTTKEIRMTSDGTPWRPLVHVLDICEAMACALEAPKEIVHNQVFNVGDTSENYRIREIAEIVASAFPGCGVVLGDSGDDNRSYRVSFEKINNGLPGFHCQRDAAMGAAELNQIFSSIGMTEEVFGHRAFTRLKQLKYLLDTRQIDDHYYWSTSL